MSNATTVPDVIIEHLNFSSTTNALPVDIFSEKSSVDCFIDNIIDGCEELLVEERNKNTQIVLTEKTIKKHPSIYLQLFARNESFNVDGAVRDTEVYPGILESFMMSRLIRLLAKGSVTTCMARAHRYGRETHARSNEITPPMPVLLIDQIGFQWQSDMYNSGGIFLRLEHETPKDDKWKSIAFKCLMGTQRPSYHMMPFVVKWNVMIHDMEYTVTGTMCEVELRVAFMKEFGLAFIAANESAKKHKVDLHLRYLKCGMGKSSSGLDNRTRAFIRVLRSEGISRYLSNIQPGLFEHIKCLEIPYGEDDTLLLNYSDLKERNERAYAGIREACNNLSIKYASGRNMDALHPIAQQDRKDNIVLAVTTCSNSHTPFGQSSDSVRVDNTVSSYIASCTNASGMLLGRRWKYNNRKNAGLELRGIHTEYVKHDDRIFKMDA